MVFRHLHLLVCLAVEGQCHVAHTTVICTWCTSTTEAAIQCNMVHLYTAVQDDEDLNDDQFMDCDDDDDDVVCIDWLISDDTNDTND